MKKYLFVFMMLSLAACATKKPVPDVSGIQVPLQTIRFEKDFFAIDTNHIEEGLDALNKKYPSFLKDYLYNILAAVPQPDSVVKYVRLFKRDYQYVYAAAEKQFVHWDVTENELHKAFQFLHYYFPQYPLPQRIVTFIGPIEGIANALTSTGMAIGLQSYLGKDFPAYQTDYITQVYPVYKSRRFEPAYIPVNCVRNILDDMYPDRSVGRPLIERMVEAGKRLYVMDAVLPFTADTLKTGYTAKQLEGCVAHEKTIWSFFVQNNLLYETEGNTINPYINDGPGTPDLGAEAPGFIGQFTGWQIVQKWMEKNPKTTLDALMQKNPKDLFDEAKYKP